MLLRFQFSNFRSFREEQELSLVAGPFRDSTAVIPTSAVPEGVLPATAIYGANASGKTNVLRALMFMREAVMSSYRRWRPDGPIPREPFLGDEKSALDQSEFRVDVLIDDVRHQYGFRLDSESILEEWLYVYPKGRRQRWFSRKQGHAIHFSANLQGENQTIENLTRRNSLFLSSAVQNNHEALRPVYNWFANFPPASLGDRLAGPLIARLLRETEHNSTINALLAAADVGVLRVQSSDEAFKPEFRRAIETLTAAMPAPEGFEKPAVPESFQKLQFLHSFASRPVLFEAEQESDGTNAYVDLLGRVINAVAKGTLCCVDELDRSLHPLLAIQLMRLFNDPAANPKGAQLLFTTHDTNLLSAGVLRRDQIWFTEKDREGASRLYPLTDFKPRKGENLKNGYLQGRYGAIPFLNPDAFLSSPQISQTRRKVIQESSGRGF